MGRIKLRHIAILFLFAVILLTAVDHETQKGPIYRTHNFTVALNQAYVHCNHTQQEILIFLTMHGDSKTPVSVKRIYVSFDSGWKRRLPIPPTEFMINSGDIVKEFPIMLTGQLLDEKEHRQVPHITVTLMHDGYTFSLKDSCHVW